MVDQLERIGDRRLTEGETWDHLLLALRGEVPRLGDGGWEEVCRLARQTGVASLLYPRLSGHPHSGEIPSRHLDDLQTSYMHTAMRNTRLYHYLKQALSALADAGIPVVVLKGAYLAKGVYRNIALRPMGDADILVPQDRLGDAARIIEGLGYRPERVIAPDRLGYRHHLPSYVNQAGTSLEVHGTAHFMHLTERLGEDELARIWERSRPWSLDGLPVRVLSPEDMMLHICLHPSTAHRFVVDLRPFFDIAQAMECEAIDWRTLLDRARNWGYGSALCLTLSLVRQWTGAVLPAEVADLITPEMDDPETVSYVRRKVLSAPHERFVLEVIGRDDQVCFTADLKPFFSRKGYRLRIGYVLDSLLPPADDILRMYPAAHGSRLRLLLAYPRRLGHLSARWCGLFRRCLRGEMTIRTTIKPEIRLRGLILRQKR